MMKTVFDLLICVLISEHQISRTHKTDSVGRHSEASHLTQVLIIFLFFFFLLIKNEIVARKCNQAQLLIFTVMTIMVL